MKIMAKAIDVKDTVDILVIAATIISTFANLKLWYKCPLKVPVQFSSH